VPYLKTLT